MYEYYCDSCGRIRSNRRSDSIECRTCGRAARRVWGFAYRPGFQGAYNPTLGRYVGSLSDLRSGLSEASDKAQTPQTSIDAHGNTHVDERPPVNYQPVDLRDKEALGVTNDGLDATYDALKRDGNDAAARRLKGFMD